jgi:transcriptional regulator
MYLPAHFKEEDVATLHALIRAHPFATLVTLGADGLDANHIPMEIDPGPGPLGTLRGHVARANPVWQSHRRDVHALAIFAGPDTYISPSWYRTKQESGRVVPTWNYVVVHAHGPLVAIDDREWLRSFVTRLTDRHEGDRPDRWHVTDAPADYIDRQLQAIVGIEIPLARLEGKWKMSQNRDAADRAGVVTGLRAAGDATSREVADHVEKTLE